MSEFQADAVSFVYVSSRHKTSPDLIDERREIDETFFAAIPLVGVVSINLFGRTAERSHSGLVRAKETRRIRRDQVRILRFLCESREMSDASGALFVPKMNAPMAILRSLLEMSPSRVGSLRLLTTGNP